MPRNMTQAYLSAMQGAVLRPALFVQAAFVSGPIYVWSGVGQITWNGQVLDWHRYAREHLDH
jgi:hypothetical protein